MKPQSIIKCRMKYVLRDYKGYIIESFNLAQLGDPETKGMAYSIYRSMDHHKSGEDSLNMAYRIDYLWEAKQFIDQHIKG
jgi:hypothetical protein